MKYIGILCVLAFNAYTSEDGLYNKYTHLNTLPYSTQLNEQQKNSTNKNYLSKKNEYNTLEEPNFHLQDDILPCMIFPKYIDKK